MPKWPDGEELYNLNSDPEEKQNLAKTHLKERIMEFRQNLAVKQIESASKDSGLISSLAYRFSINAYAFCLLSWLCYGRAVVRSGRTPIAAAVIQNDILPLIQKHCVQCHGPEKQKGKFRIDTLAANLHEGGSAGYWHEVLDQLNEGEMPPEDETQLTETELNRFTTWLESGLKQAAAKRSSTGGRQLMRRMSRYRTSIHWRICWASGSITPLTSPEIYRVRMVSRPTPSTLACPPCS